MLTPQLRGVHTERLVTGFGSPLVVLILVMKVSRPNLLAAKASSFPAGIAKSFADKIRVS
jgi:hypothetical protein